MKKLSILIMTLCLLLAGCQLAKPGSAAKGDPAGVWLELHHEGDALPEGYAPTVDFEARGESFGLVLSEETVDEQGQVCRSFGSKVSPCFMERGFGSHTNIQDDTMTTQSESFAATLYVDANAGAAPDEVWAWYLYPDGQGGYVAGTELANIFYLRQYSLQPEGTTLTQTISYKTGGDMGQGKEASYAFSFKAIGRLERVRILEFDADFNRLSTVSLEIEDGDEYRAKPGTAHVIIAETYVTDGKEKTVSSPYSAGDALDYDGEMALYHACKYMGPDGIVMPRSLKIVF